MKMRYIFTLLFLGLIFKIEGQENLTKEEALDRKTSLDS